MSSIQNTGQNSGITRRAFLQISLRTGIALLGSGLVQSCKRKKKIKGPIVTPREKTLELLKEIKNEYSISPRYDFFIEKMIELIKAHKIHIEYIDTKDPRRPDTYNLKTNTMEINPVALKLRSKSSFIHELFHAYQDWQRKALPNSFVEAEAHLAENDYLFHCDKGPGLEAWLTIETDPNEKKGFLLGFNVPVSLIRGISHADFCSYEYRQAVRWTAYNYLWAMAFFAISKRVLGVLASLNRSRMNDNTIMHFRKFHLNRMRLLPDSQVLEFRIIGGKMNLNVSNAIVQFMGSSRYLIRKLWESGKKAESQALLSRTFEEFKHALRASARIYSLDHIRRELFDGIK